MFRGYKPAAILTSNNDMGAKPAKDQTSLASATEATVLAERPQLARAQTAPEEPATNTASTEAPALPIRTRMEATMARILVEPDTRARVEAQGMTVLAAGSEEFAAFQEAEMIRWARLVQEAGIRLEG